MSNFDMMKVYTTQHNPIMDSLVNMLCKHTGKSDRGFFKASVAFFMGSIPSALRATIDSPERGKLPVNIYSIAMATSGFGKGHSVNILQKTMSEFVTEYKKTLRPAATENNLFNLATKISIQKGTDQQEEYEQLQKELKLTGTPLWVFDGGTVPALKQLRHGLQLSGIGSMNLQMDEMGSNLLNNTEMFQALLELYDLGVLNTKLIKNTKENTRGLDLVSQTPANMLIFGTDSKVFDGSVVEDEFYSMLESGFARRSIFGFASGSETFNENSPEEVYRRLVNNTEKTNLKYWKNFFKKFADEKYLNKTLTVPETTGIELVSYRLYCENRSLELGEHDTIKKAEMKHRFFKALKLAGVYAFLDDSSSITLKHLYEAIKLIEENSEDFYKLMKREKNFVRLCKYLASNKKLFTHADLVEELAYYPKGAYARTELMNLAIAWGYNRHILIKKQIINGIEFFDAEVLDKTDPNKLLVSCSKDQAKDYKPKLTSLPVLGKKLFTVKDGHWANHSFEDGIRRDEKAIEGFNLIVIDCDGEVKINQAHELLSKYEFMTYTTKRHGLEGKDRFRLVMPMQYILKLPTEDYKVFMENVLLWLPFDCDKAANQRNRKWLTNDKATVFYNKGEYINPLPFMPNTSQNTQFKTVITDLQHLEHLERWFLNQMNEGNRNNNLLRYGMCLLDAGKDFADIKNSVLNLNKFSAKPLRESEVTHTVLNTITKKYKERNQ